MALTLRATAGANNANSYATLTEAAAFMETNQHKFTTWTEYEDDVKKAALMWATRILDEQYEWIGEKRTKEQALRWPRSGVADRDGYDVSYETIPTFLKNATIELASQLAVSDRFATIDEAAGGIKSVTAGAVSVEFDRLDRINVVPDSVNNMIAFYTTGSSVSSMSVKLERV